MTSAQDETSQAARPPLGFATNTLDRRSEERTSLTLSETFAHPNASFFIRAVDGFLCDVSNGTPSPIMDRAAFTQYALEDDPDLVFLGHDAVGVPFLAVPAYGDDPRPDHIKAIDLRSLASQGVLAPEIEGRLAHAQHLLLWHRSNRFCTKCGGETVKEAAGATRRCTRCDETIFPRINPVSIMLIHDGRERCLLGRQPHFPERSWSCLAGFVEAGETLEHAVRRETREEAGIEVGAVRYLFSQPWPFSSNLMLGFMAKATTTDIRFDSKELEACRWFERDEVASMLAGDHVDGLVVPPPLAIARHLIQAFVDGER